MTKKVTELKLTEQQLLLEYSLSHGINIRDRVIRLTDEIDSYTVDIVDTAISEMQREGRGGITVKICSPGGCVYSALAIVDLLRNCKRHITTIGIGSVFSAATLILACGKWRQIGKSAFVMHHEAYSGEVSGRVSDLDEYVTQLKREERVWAEAMAEFTKYKDFKFWQKQAYKKDWYLDSKEAVTYGIADEVL